MNYFIFELLFLLLHFFLVAYFPVSNANDSLEEPKNLLAEYVENLSYFKQYCKENDYYISKKNLAILKLASKTPFGLLYFLRKNWDCDKIGDKFTGWKEIEGCHTYQAYVGIVYEYLNRLNAGTGTHPPVEPKFYFDKIYAYSTLTETVESLAIIGKFYFNTEFGQSKGHKLETLFIRYYKPKLLNKKELNYKANLDISEENPTEFDKFMKKKLKRMEKKVGCKTENFNECVKLLPDRDIDDTLNDDYFIAFVRGKRYFDELWDELEEDDDGQLNEHSGFWGLSRKEEMERSNAISMANFNMLKKQCNSVDNVVQSESKVCEYVNILYEYLFQVYANAQKPNLAQTRPAVRPLFKYGQNENRDLRMVITHLQNSYNRLSTGNEEKNKSKLELENANEFADFILTTKKRKNFDQEMAMHEEAATTWIKNL